MSERITVDNAGLSPNALEFYEATKGTKLGELYRDTFETYSNKEGGLSTIPKMILFVLHKSGWKIKQKLNRFMSENI